jgi:hypothetical protein
MQHNLPGEILTTEWKMDNTVVAYGFRPADNNEAALQGIHAPNLYEIVIWQRLLEGQRLPAQPFGAALQFL